MYTSKLRHKATKSTVVDTSEVFHAGKKRKRAHEPNIDTQDDIFENSNNEAPSKPDCLITSRKRRMASLNAIAKVTAVLSDYHIERKESTPSQSNTKKDTATHGTHNGKSLSSNVPVGKKHGNSKPSPSSEKILSSDKRAKSAFTVVPQQSKSNNSFIGVDKSTQTSYNDKSVQTVENTSYENRPTICTCPNKDPIVISLYFPLKQEHNNVDCPIHIKSNVLVHNDNETLSIPIIKKHYAPPSSSTTSGYKITMTDNISQLQSSCLQSFLLQHSCETAKLIFLNSLQEKLKKEQLADIKDEKPDISKLKRKNDLFTVPTLTFPSLSVPSTDKLAIDEKNKLYPIVEKSRRTTSKQKPKNSCNGWVFEGTPVHETIKQNNQSFVRKYYPTIRRDDEVIHLQDAVILKSDDEMDATDYVARILEFWEDSGGHYAGDMMMSVLWYYKPEQMRVRYSDVDFAEMELFASRHKDDNSVACILDKCYVVSYSQYCRFHSQRKLFNEKRTSKNSLVPQSDNIRSRWLPSPTTNLSLVYFCQYGYDFRSGKIIKHY